jgi:RNA polymerase sigma factor (sigma-70 family)
MKTDQDLIEGLRNGDRQSFSIIYDEFYESLYFYLLKFSIQEDLVQNAIQDTFVDLWHSRKSLGEIKSLKSYLLVCSRRKLFKVLKSNQLLKFTDFISIQGESENYFHYAQEDFLVEKEISEDRKRGIVAAINKLPGKQKESVYLRYYENLTIEEISDVQKIAYQSVLNNLQRAFQVLRSNPMITHLFKFVSIIFIFF